MRWVDQRLDDDDNCQLDDDGDYAVATGDADDGDVDWDAWPDDDDDVTGDG